MTAPPPGRRERLQRLERRRTRGIGQRQIDPVIAFVRSVAVTHGSLPYKRTCTAQPAEPAPSTSANRTDREHARRIGRRLDRAASRRRRVGAALDYLFGTETRARTGPDGRARPARPARPPAMKELADRLRVDPSTATRAVQRLVADGLAERFPSRRRRPGRARADHRPRAAGATTPSPPGARRR